MIGALLRQGLQLAWADRGTLRSAWVVGGLGIAVNALLWTRLDGVELRGVAAHELGARVVVGLCLGPVLVRRLEIGLSHRLRTGAFLAELCRPIAPVVVAYLSDLGRAMLIFAAVAAPQLLILHGLEVAPLRPGLGALVALLVGHAMGFSLSYLVGLGGLFFVDTAGLSRVKGALIALGAGVMVPYGLLPPILATMLRWSPFAALGHGPAGALLGPVDGPALFVGAVWAAVSLLLCQQLEGRVSRRFGLGGG